jgi:hypothetical protein
MTWRQQILRIYDTYRDVSEEYGYEVMEDV